MTVDPKLVEILACPICNGKVVFNQDKTAFICRADKLAFPIEDSIPVMLEDQARPATEDELKK